MNVIQEMQAYYFHNRGVGHTELLKKGIENYDQKFYIVVSNMRYGRDLIRQMGNPNAIPIILSDITSYKLRGTCYPIALDNSAIMQLCSYVLYRTDKLTDDLIAKNTELINKIIELENRLVEPPYFHEEKSYSWWQKIFNWLKSRIAWL